MNVAKRLAYSATREDGVDFVEVIDRRLGGKWKLSRLLCRAVMPAVKDRSGLHSLLEALEGQVS